MSSGAGTLSIICTDALRQQKGLTARPVSVKRSVDPRNERKPHDTYQLSQNYHVKKEKGRGMHLTALAEYYAPLST